LDNWQLSAFVDLDSGGVGDRHFDLYYGQWSLEYNLKTSKYNSRFLDAYGRDKIDDKMFRLIEVCDLFL
jgi:kanamycin kinase